MTVEAHAYFDDEMKTNAMTDAQFNAVRALAAEGRPIPAIVMAAILERLQARGAGRDEPVPTR